MINIDKHQVRELVPMSDAIEAMRWAFTQLSNGNVLLPTRASMDIPDKNATTLVMPAYAMGSPYFTVKIVSVNYSNPQKGLPMINAVVHVFNAEEGKLLVWPNYLYHGSHPYQGKENRIIISANSTIDLL